MQFCLCQRGFPRTGRRGPRRGWTLKDMARSPEHKTPSGLAGGKKMSMVAGRRCMKLKLNWTQGQKNALIKRTADALEKLAIGSLLVGVFPAKTGWHLDWHGVHGGKLYFDCNGG